MGDIIWFAMAIPVLVSVILYFFFNHKVVWWEFLLPFTVSIIVILVAKLLMGFAGTRDTEYWGSIVEDARYYEAWDEYIHQTCTRTYACGTDANGNTQYCTETYDCSYVEYHSEYWEINTTSGERFNISESYYNILVRQFGMKPQFQDMHRDYHYNDGDMYWVKWDGSKEDAEPMFSKHTYKNKVQASDDVFNFPDVDTSEISMYGLYQYPEFNGSASNNYPSILGYSDNDAQAELHYWNGLLGPRAQCRIWILVYDYPTNQAGLTQEALWKGGNKNELVVTIGIDTDSTVIWCYPFTWSEVQVLPVNIRTFVEAQGKLNLMDVVNYVGTESKDKFVRKEFEDFEYLEVQPPTWTVVTSFIFVLLFNLGVSWFVIANHVTETPRHRYRRRY